MRQWIDQGLPKSARSKSGAEERKVGGGGRIGSGINERKKSTSPNSRMRK